MHISNRAMFMRMIFGSLVRRSSRMLVALLAVAVGATVLLGMLAVYYDIPRQMGREFRSYGANMILVPSGERGVMDVKAAAIAAKAIPKDKLLGLTPYRYEPVSINRQPFTAAGTAFKQARKTSPFWNVTGKWPEKLSEIIIGADVADFAGLQPGSEVKISGRDREGKPFAADMRVAGVLKTGGAEESMIFMELPAMEKLMGGKGEVGIVEASVTAPEEELERLVDDIHAASTDVAANLVKRVTSSEATVLGKLRALMFLVTAVVLALTMICVGTTMMAVVLERRREIGLKKALGAENRSIVLEFLGEGTLLGLAGGGIGVVLGFQFAQLVGMSVFNRSVSFDPLLAPATIAASAAVTVLACLVPVGRTASVDPALVLKGE